MGFILSKAYVDISKLEEVAANAVAAHADCIRDAVTSAEEAIGLLSAGERVVLEDEVKRCIAPDTRTGQPYCEPHIHSRTH
jgi:hypothetical protein